MERERKTLLIYEEIPDKTSFYLIPNSEISPNHRLLLEHACNRFIENDDDDPSHPTPVVYEHIIDTEQAEEKRIFGDHVGIWTKYKSTFPIEDNISHVYFMGTYL